MPGRNGTGPSGMGPKTGRGMGNCNPKKTGNGIISNLGQGFGLGRGQGRGQGLGKGLGLGRRTNNN